MTEREFRIAICGTFDVENYGDLLFPLIAEAELSRRLGRIKLHRFSYYRKSRKDWPYEVTPLSELPDLIGKLDGVIIGGGHMLRFDKWTAKNYIPPESIHHPGGYWLSPVLIALSNRLPVVWNAPGGNGVVPRWAEALMTIAIQGSSYVSVREHQLRTKLKRFAGNKEISVVPDTAFGVVRLVDVNKPSADVVRLRSECGLINPYIIIQATSDLLPFVRFLAEHPQIVAGHQVLVLSTGPINGDDDAVFSEAPANAVRLSAWPKPTLITELIAGASFVVGVSLHLSISALAFGVPIFRPARFFDDKYVILKGLDGVFSFDDSRPIDADQFTFVPAPREPASAISSLLDQLETHWDKVASVFSEPQVSCACTTTNEFWHSIPTLLETRDEALRDLAVRTKKVADIHNSTSWKLTAPLRYFADLWR